MRSFVLNICRLAALGCICLAGCTEENRGDDVALSKGDANPKTHAKVGGNFIASPISPSIKPQDSILRVNGTDITRAQYDMFFRIREKVFRRANGIAMGAKDDKVRRYMASCRNDIIGIFIRRTLLQQAAEKKGLKVTDAMFSRLASVFLRYVKAGGQDLDVAMAKFLTPEEAAFNRKGIEIDALGEVYLRSWSTNDLEHVSDVEVTNRIAKIKAINEKTTRLNDEARRKAAEAKAEILAGGSFYEVTTNRCDLSPEQGREWDTYELGELEPEDPLFRFLAGAKQGDISDPMDFDDGIGIVGVVLKEMGEAPEGYTPAEQFTLVRCLFRAYDPIEESDDASEVRRIILDERRSQARLVLGDELMKSAKIEYPSGENIFRKKTAKKSKNKPVTKPVGKSEPAGKGK